MFNKSDFIRKDEVVSCGYCKCLIKLYEAYIVECEGSKFYYCGQHKKPYNQIYFLGNGLIYKGIVLMDIDGTPIGYKKIKE